MLDRFVWKCPLGADAEVSCRAACSEGVFYGRTFRSVGSRPWQGCEHCGTLVAGLPLDIGAGCGLTGRPVASAHGLISTLLCSSLGLLLFQMIFIEYAEDEVF
jgi:hypothetical protein